jgi:hypothetical protein
MVIIKTAKNQLNTKLEPQKNLAKRCKISSKLIAKKCINYFANYAKRCNSAFEIIAKRCK